METPEELDDLRREAEAWRERNAGALKAGRKAGKFVSPSGFDIQPVYTPVDLAASGWSYARDLGMPGDYPYTRSPDPAGYRREFWGWEFYAGFGSAEEANKRYRYLMEQGATGGVSIALDLPTQLGLDPDDELATGEVGRVGVSITSLADVERLFSGIELGAGAAKNVFSTANAIGPIFLAWIMAFCEKRGIDTSSFVVQIQNDPIKEYVARGTQIFPIRPSVKLSGDVIEHSAKHTPNWLPISVSGSHMKQAGGSCLQEAAFTINNAIAYVEEVRSRGLHVDDFGAGVEIHFCADMAFFEEVAKLRATRRIWAELMRERWGARNEAAIRGRLHSATSGLPLTAQQPMNNIVRITMQVLSQVLGGIQAGRTASFDEALAIPTQEAVTLALRTNQVIAHETGIADVVDPLGGSYYVEWLTNKMDEGIKEYIRKIDEMGGSIKAVENGFIAGELSDGAYRQQLERERGESIIIGVNKYRTDTEPDVPISRHNPAWEKLQVERVQELRRTRDSRATQASLERLREVSSRGENVVPATIDAVKAYATVGEICGVWREVFGEFVATGARV